MSSAPLREEDSPSDAPAAAEERDDEVVARILAGDTEAFNVVVRRYRRRCLRYALHALGSMADAEDVVQEAFVRCYDGLGRYDRRGRFEAWLLAILAFECRTALTARGRAAARQADTAALDAQPAPSAPLAEPDAGARIDRALARLPAPLREAFLLHHVEELSFPEMAKATGVGISALKMRVKRARESLRALLGAP